MCEGKKNIVVIGGGDVAVDVARTARRLCGKDALVTMVAPEKEGEFPAIPEGIEEAHEEGIRMMGGYSPVEFPGDGVARLAGTTVEKDPVTGAYTLSMAEGDDIVIDADLVLVAIGQAADIEPLLPGSADEASSRVYVNNMGMTRLPGFYAGGDLTGQRPAVADAVQSGKRAALAIHLNVNGYDGEKIMQAVTLGQGSSLSVSAFLDKGRIDTGRVVQFAELNTLIYRKTERHIQAKSSSGARLAGFKEVTAGLDSDSAMDEAKRCFYCGSCVGCDLCFYLCPDISITKEGDRTYSVKTDYCKGCSICATVCPRHVIEVENRL